MNQMEQRKLKVSLHTWEPGLYSSANTSAGGAVWLKSLMRYLKKQSIEVVDISRSSSSTPPNVDVAWFCWRWDFPDDAHYRERHVAYLRQMHLLKWYHEHGTPIVIHDQDYMISPRDREYLWSINASLYEPSLKPRPGFKSLHFPFPYGRLAVKSKKEKTPGLVYVGNNYERYPQFVDYVGHRFNILVPAVYGNWLEPGIGRESPEQVKRDCPDVDFRGRLQQSEVLETMARFTATIHLAKPEYCANGFLTIRWAEAVAANCIGLVPAEFLEIPEVKSLYVTPKTIEAVVVNAATDYEVMSRMLHAQSEFVKGVMHPYAWAAMFRSEAR